MHYSSYPFTERTDTDIYCSTAAVHMPVRTASLVLTAFNPSDFRATSNCPGGIAPLSDGLSRVNIARTSVSENSPPY